MRFSSPAIERARPLLGTTVAIRVHGLCESRSHTAIDDAFAEIAVIHRLMSFQEPDSDISRLNREAPECTQFVHPATYEVLHWAIRIAQASDGCFDITMAPGLVARGLLPTPQSRHAPDPQACWHDIELSGDFEVRFRRPLWIDVSGIAKGYAVDRALEILQGHGATQACVNAGGDLRVFGPDRERVILRTEHPLEDAVPILDIENASVASSSGLLTQSKSGAIPANRFVSVVAPSCLIADALTKPVLILEERSADLLRSYGASAHLYDRIQGWRHLAGEAT